MLLERLAIRERAPGPLFAPISQRGRLLPRRLTDKAVTWILQDRAQAAEVAAFSPHDLRHTWISTLLDADPDLITVADLTGHANIVATAKDDRRGQAAKCKAALLPTVPVIPTTRVTAYRQLDILTYARHDGSNEYPDLPGSDPVPTESARLAGRGCGGRDGGPGP